MQLSSGWSYPYGFGWFLLTSGAVSRSSSTVGSWQDYSASTRGSSAMTCPSSSSCERGGRDPERIADGLAAIIDPRLAVPVLAPDGRLSRFSLWKKE